MKPASWQRAFTSYRLASGKSTGYGYGWEMGKLQGVPTIAHGGAINGFATYALRLPEQKVYVAVLSNADGGVISPALVVTKAAASAIGKPLREFKEIALAPAALDRFTGVYEVEPKVTRSFRREGNTLVMQRSGRPPMPLKAYSPTGFFLPDSLDYFEFGLDAKGAVSHVTQFHDGAELRQARIGDLPPERPAVKIAGTAFDSRAGRYELAPGFVLTLSREGERLYAQATGQPKLEIFAQDENVFFSRAIEAEVRFDGADSSYLVLHQNGQQIKARRL
ncbi:serine hydrolase [Massilia sp. Se16.2.3]|uniref:serine hydrolase n=1 Tax=Massilia sp. Se16.2.3 TaxID=2709303 RepID=UPI0022771AF5|nr:serine hydrolase [Massilia sp. Se16.2.3]